MMYVTIGVFAKVKTTFNLSLIMDSIRFYEISPVTPTKVPLEYNRPSIFKYNDFFKKDIKVLYSSKSQQ